MKEFCALRAKTYSYLMNDNSEVKKSKGTKKCVIKRELMFENYKDCLFNEKIILKSQQDLKAIIIMYIQKKSIKLHYVAMVIKDYKHLIGLKHILMEQMLLKYVKVKC